MAYDISHVLSPTDTDISPSGGILSREFRVVTKSVVRLEGTVGGEWDVESRRKDGTEWVSETEEAFLIGQRPTATIKQVTIEGNPNLVYRINLGTGNDGPDGFVYPVAVQSFL